MWKIIKKSKKRRERNRREWNTEIGKRRSSGERIREIKKGKDVG